MRRSWRVFRANWSGCNLGSCDEGVKVCIVFEGRDTAGKGGVIKRITERVSPRVFRVVALPKPTERERSQMYIQRYLRHFPAAGEAVIFDRSWYNRAGVERVMGFCTEDDASRFLRMVPLVEQAMVDSGIILLKYWLEVGEEEQTRRLRSRIDDPRKLWKLSPMDLDSYSRWYEYPAPATRCSPPPAATSLPWLLADSNDKKRARLNIIGHLLEQIPYESPPASRREAAGTSEASWIQRSRPLKPVHPGRGTDDLVSGSPRRAVAGPTVRRSPWSVRGAGSHCRSKRAPARSMKVRVPSPTALR